MTRYAARTQVPVSRSRAEIEALLLKHGATEFVCGFSTGGSAVVFTIEGMRVRIHIPIVQSAQEERRRWRAALLILKAKLELIADEGSTLQREFLADIMLPKGGTVGEYLEPQLAKALGGGQMPRLLP